MVVLTESSILTRARVPELHNVLKLNVWGCDLTDVSVVSRCSNLQVFSASCNELTTLRDLESCLHLQELYVRENKISDIEDIFCLSGLSKLRIFWLAGNPCCEIFGGNIETYRLFILKHLSNLERLDNSEVTEEERNKAKNSSGELPNSQPRKSKSPSDFDSGDKKESFAEKNDIRQPEVSQQVEHTGIEPHATNFDNSSHQTTSPMPDLTQPSSRSGVSVPKPVMEKRMNGKKVPEKKSNRLPVVNSSVPTRLRNANILNAALSLVKELDGDSLEILELDIHNRLSMFRGDVEI